MPLTAKGDRLLGFMSGSSSTLTALVGLACEPVHDYRARIAYHEPFLVLAQARDPVQHD